MSVEHRCRFRTRLAWADWATDGDLERRHARRLPACSICGRERPARRPRPVVLEEVRCRIPRPGILLEETARRVAAALLPGVPHVGARGLLGRLAASGTPASAVELALEDFLRRGWVELRWRRRGTRRELLRVRVLDPEALEEATRPGLRESRRAAHREALELLSRVEHPIAAEARRILASEAPSDPGFIRALAAVAVHAASGEILSERVFSARHLGDSKALGRHRRRLERLLGPLDALGIREGAALTLAGGRGILLLRSGARVDLETLRPFAGFSRETLLSLDALRCPPAGLLVVENLTAFEACCRGEVGDLSESLAVWSAGYPGRGVRAFVEAADRAGAPVRVWADLDLDGVRIARLVASWTHGAFSAYRMSPDEVARARARRPLTAAAEAGIRRDLERHPDALLAETLKALLVERVWVEQEALLGG